MCSANDFHYIKIKWKSNHSVIGMRPWTIILFPEYKDISDILHYY